MSTIVLYPTEKITNYSYKERYKYDTWNIYETFVKFINEVCEGIRVYKEDNEIIYTNIKEVHLHLNNLLSEEFADGIYNTAIFPVISIESTIENENTGNCVRVTECCRLFSNMDTNIYNTYYEKGIDLLNVEDQSKNGICYDVFNIPTKKYGNIKCGIMYDFSDHINDGENLMQNLEVKPKIIITLPESTILDFSHI